MFMPAVVELEEVKEGCGAGGCGVSPPVVELDSGAAAPAGAGEAADMGEDEDKEEDDGTVASGLN